MTKRTKVAYVAVFKTIEDRVVPLKPKSIMSDYETPLRNALRIVYKCTARSCYFHFTQAVRKNAKQMPGFFGAMNANPSISGVYHRYLVLPLLPKEMILDGHRHCNDLASAYGDKFDRFIAYFTRQWIDKVCYVLGRTIIPFRFLNNS